MSLFIPTQILPFEYITTYARYQEECDKEEYIRVLRRENKNQSIRISQLEKDLEDSEYRFQRYREHVESQRECEKNIINKRHGVKIYRKKRTHKQVSPFDE